MNRKRITSKKFCPVFTIKEKFKPPKWAVVVHWTIGLIVFCIAIILWGCATKTITITEYKEVKIPVKCAIATPKKPMPTKNAVEMNLLILKYAEELEAALRGCNGTL